MIYIYIHKYNDFASRLNDTEMKVRAIALRYYRTKSKHTQTICVIENTQLENNIRDAHV